MFRPLAQTSDGSMKTSMELSVRMRGSSPDALVRPLGTTLTAIDPDLALTIRPFTQNIDRAVRQERLVAMLSGFFGGLALLLAAIGLYGVTSYSVQRRRAEIGIRLALGARPDRIVRMVLARAGWLVTVGVVSGTLMSIWIVRYVSTLLYGVQPRDPMTLAIAVVALGIVALIAAWLPARRASRIDPTLTLRAE
jgi:ABC-type antimicrobial peptide transport system permease subunit